MPAFPVLFKVIFPFGEAITSVGPLSTIVQWYFLAMSETFVWFGATWNNRWNSLWCGVSIWSGDKYFLRVSSKTFKASASSTAFLPDFRTCEVSFLVADDMPR